MSLTKENLLDVFDNLDPNDSGKVDTIVLTDALERAGVPASRIQRLMSAMNPDNESTISKNKYRVTLGLTAEPKDEFKRLFFMLDENRSGKVTSKELKTLFANCGISYTSYILDAWIAENDVNGDGQIEFKEFLGFVAEHNSKS